MGHKRMLNLGLAALVLGGLLMTGTAGAGSKNMEAGKRDAYQDNTYESMRDYQARRKDEASIERKQLLANSKETVKLLREIRDLLKEQNARN